ncbi:uncharacterized protein Dana_GF13363, isoform B [Drosophila ananassae]|uniref:Regulatory protein zeste n=1 Tax=Drosophila ananassae TaxID=7217 RepID=A0A0P8Y549_DROAN|nr:uncharacterized protein LOC6496205 [Drosophila ananassae]KPU76672.1 uncharacterized protein Dana_GF13363, isoform B [Drosophila ananassae]
MGKHRNAAQDAVFVAFMERHPIIAKNYLKGDKQAAEEAWKRLSKELNNVGPPLKDTSQWKRVWKDWKSCITKKITNNRLEDSKVSGKWSLYQDTLTPLEDAVAVISDLYDMADTIVEARPNPRSSDMSNSSVSSSLRNIKKDQDDCPLTDKEDCEEEKEEEVDEEDCDNPISVRSLRPGRRTNTSTIQTTPKKRKRVHEDALSLEQDTAVPVLMDIAKELRDLSRQTRLNAQRSEANTQALLALGTQISDLMQQQLRERKRLNVIMEKFVLKMESAE